MLEHYFSRPSTIDRIRSLWLGAPISRYAEWLSARQQSRASAIYKIQTLVLFDRFVSDRHVRALEDLPAQMEPFIVEWKRTRGRNPHTPSYARLLRAGPRPTLEELLRLVLPGFVGTDRRQPWPLQDLAPGFLDHLRDKRGLRPDTLHRYEHHLRVFIMVTAACGVYNYAITCSGAPPAASAQVHGEFTSASAAGSTKSAGGGVGPISLLFLGVFALRRVFDSNSRRTIRQQRGNARGASCSRWILSVWRSATIAVAHQ